MSCAVIERGSWRVTRWRYLPGFTSARIKQWFETYRIKEPGLPNTTSSAVPGDQTDTILSTPIPEQAGPNIVEARPEPMGVALWVLAPDQSDMAGSGPP